MHDLLGVVVVEARPCGVDVHAVVIVLSAIEAEEFGFGKERLHEACINKIVAEVTLITAVFVVFRFFADCCLDRVLVNIADGGKELTVAVDRRALKRGLEEAADALVFPVVPVDKTGDDALENAPERDLAGLDDEVDMVGHQAVTEDLVAADRLVPAEDFQKLFKVFLIFENILLVDAAIDDVVNTEGTDFALGSWHRRDLFDLSFVVEMGCSVICRQLSFEPLSFEPLRQRLGQQECPGMPTALETMLVIKCL